MTYFKITHNDEVIALRRIRITDVIMCHQFLILPKYRNQKRAKKLIEDSYNFLFSYNKPLYVSEPTNIIKYILFNNPRFKYTFENKNLKVEKC